MTTSVYLTNKSKENAIYCRKYR